MKGPEELVPFVSMQPEQASLTLVKLYLSSFDGSGHAPLLCNQGSNFSMCVMVSLELSCNSPVLLGFRVVVHGSVYGVIGKGFKEPMGKFPFFVDSDALRWEQLMSIDGLVNTDGAQTVQPFLLDIGGEDMDGVITISDWDEEVKDISFIFLIPLQSLCLLVPIGIPPVSVSFPVLVGFFQLSHMCLTLFQILPLLLEYFQLPLVISADFLILACNSSQSLHNEEELFSPRGAMSFKSSAH